jgi:hypothetical protein
MAEHEVCAWEGDGEPAAQILYKQHEFWMCFEEGCHALRLNPLVPPIEQSTGGGCLVGFGTHGLFLRPLGEMCLVPIVSYSPPLACSEEST